MSRPSSGFRGGWLEDFKANPHLTIAKVVATMSANNGSERKVRPDLANALDQVALDQVALDRVACDQVAREAGEPRAAGPVRPTAVSRPLAGSVTVRRNRTSTTQSRTLSFAPTAAERAALLAGEHLAHDLLASGMPNALAAQADAIAHYADPIFKAYAVRQLERSGVRVAEAATRHYLNHCKPAGFAFTRTSRLARWYTDQLDLTGETTGELVDEERFGRNEDVARLLARPRLTWTHPAGVEHGILLDRFHHTHQRGAIERDTWIRSKVAADLTSIDALLRPTYLHDRTHIPGVANLGVRVHAHRAPNVGVHFLPDYAGGSGRPVPGGHHRIGGCEHCAPRPSLPNAHVSSHASSGAMSAEVTA